MAALSITLDSINLFDNPRGRGRATNDSSNTTRENILSRLNSTDFIDYFSDPTFGEKWNTLKNRFNDVVCKMVSHEYQEIEPVIFDILHLGGRRHNYDLLICFYKPIIHFHRPVREFICEKKVEFKFNATSIQSLPQFLSLSAKHEIMSNIKYPLFYFTYFLPRIFELLPDRIPIEPSLEGGPITYRPEFPSQAEYMRNIGKTTYSCHPLFEYMIKCESIEKDKKDAIVNESIAEYLEQHADTIDFVAFSNKVKESQTDKIFLLYDPITATFKTDTINTDINNLRFKTIKNKNIIVLEDDIYEFHLLLRWRNHKGCLNPAWQISLNIK